MIIGITGTIGSGKGKIAEIIKKNGFVHHSLSAEIREIAKERGVVIDREDLQELGGKLREESPKDSILGERVLEHVKRDVRHGETKFVIEGIRDPDEIELFRKHEFDGKAMRFVLIGVDAPQEVRFKRMHDRRRHGDPKAIAEFKRLDEKEIKGSTGQEVGKCMKMADYLIDNSGSLEALKKKVDKILMELHALE